MMATARLHTFSNSLYMGRFSRHYIQLPRHTLRLYHHLLTKPRLVLASKPLQNYPKTRLKSDIIAQITKLQKQHGLTILMYGAIGTGCCVVLLGVCYFVHREYKKMKLLLRGVSDVYVPEWKKADLARYKDTTLPQFVVCQLDKIEEFEVRPDDIWIVSFPRSGTTWLQEIVYLLNTSNWTEAKTTKLDDRFPYFEFMFPGLKTIEEMKSPRLIKSHLPLSLLPRDMEKKKPKIIYIARNPKDVVVSYFFFVRKLKPVSHFDGKFETFYDCFIQDKVMYAPWWKHVLQFWDRRDDKNILFITYEDLKMDTSGTVRKVAKFLGKSVTDAELDKIIDHCSFKKMQKNKMVNHSWFVPLGVALASESSFVRKGCIGDWTNHITREMNPRIDRMIVTKLRGSELKFTYQSNRSVQETDSIYTQG